MISTDRKLFESGSEVSHRLAWQSAVFDRLDIVVCNLRKSKLKKTKINDRLTLYPTNSRSRWLYFLDVWRLGGQILTADKIDWVSAQDPFELGLMAWVLARGGGAKLQLQIHTDPFSPFYAQESFMNRLRIKFMRWLLPRADSIRVVSNRLKQEILDQKLCSDSSKIFVLPVSMDIGDWTSRSIVTDLHKKYPQFSKIILLASRLTPEKEVGLAIDAFKELVDHRSDQVGLVIVGEGESKYTLIDQVSRLGLTERVIFEPWTTDLVSYYKTADIFLLTSRYEGYGRTIIEAASVGLPIVVTDVGVAREVIVDGVNGFVVPVGNRAKICRSLSQLLDKHIPRNDQSKDWFKHNLLVTDQTEYRRLLKDSFSLGK